MKNEIRAYYVPKEKQIRAVAGEGTFEGYAVVWNVIDSHGTSFRKGSFAKTLKERGDQIKILYNHDTDEPIGKPLEMREDDYGLFVRGQLTAGVKRADETALNIAADVIDTLSIGFKTEKDRPAGEFREITEVKLYEFSPVTFASNEKARITGFRSEDFAVPDNRSTDFQQTMDISEVMSRQHLLMDSLSITLSDIWWSNMSSGDIVSAIDTALADFHTQYMAWTNEFVSLFFEQRHEIMAGKDLAGVFQSEIRKAGETIETMAGKTSCTITELKALARGKLIPMASRDKLTELPVAIGEAHHEKRKKMVESLCHELRTSQFSEAEAARFTALLGLNKRVETKIDDVFIWNSEPILENLRRLTETI
ncbi:MAG: HK97 family phage prohead protease [bacterium]|nr:HK97 family phage prohead protease [bacterium]